MNRDEFFRKLKPRPTKEIKKIRIAYWLSESVHRGQKRDNGERYFEHPLRVALSLTEHGHHETNTLVSALLHDVIEETRLYLIPIGRETYPIYTRKLKLCRDKASA